jgi:hypothetical protein
MIKRINCSIKLPAFRAMAVAATDIEIRPMRGLNLPVCKNHQEIDEKQCKEPHNFKFNI